VSERVRIRILIFVLALFTSLAMTASHAAAGNPFSCSNTDHNGAGADGTTNPSGLDGVQGYIYVPSYSTANLHGQVTTVADIAAVVIDDHFFQFGWYVGQASQLPVAGKPMAFAGEGSLSGNWETLTQLGSLTPGTFHYFSLYRNQYNHWVAEINHGGVIWSSTMTNSYSVYPRMLGESNFDCADMSADASASNNGPTLQLHHSGGSWANWQEHVNLRFGTPADVPSCYYDGRVNGYSATVLAFDLC
jgi:hypothetical protein